VLGNVAAVASVPMVAIGGIDPTNVASVCAAGAHGVAVIRAILAATDPAAATRTLLATMH
jgi:thiamine-phosphate pyrophosphorylase